MATTRTRRARGVGRRSHLRAGGRLGRRNAIRGRRSHLRGEGRPRRNLACPWGVGCAWRIYYAFHDLLPHFIPHHLTSDRKVQAEASCLTFHPTPTFLALLSAHLKLPSPRPSWRNHTGRSRWISATQKIPSPDPRYPHVRHRTSPRPSHRERAFHSERNCAALPAKCGVPHVFSTGTSKSPTLTAGRAKVAPSGTLARAARYLSRRPLACRRRRAMYAQSSRRVGSNRSGAIRPPGQQSGGGCGTWSGSP